MYQFREKNIIHQYMYQGLIQLFSFICDNSIIPTNMHFSYTQEKCCILIQILSNGKFFK